MRTIAFLSQKGGSGKTTLAIHVAVAAEQAREQVVLIDTDPQRSATAWASARSASTPVIATAAASRLAQVLEAARSDAITLAIVDTAPHTAPDAATVASLVDLLVIPVRPTALDMAAVAGTLPLVSKRNAVFVLSACPSRSPEIEETRQVLKTYNLPVFPGIITDRRAFARALASGQAVSEFDPDSKAALEIRALWKFLKENSK